MSEISDLLASLGITDKPIKITPDTPIIVGGADTKTICKFIHVGRVVQHSITGSDNVPVGARQEFTVIIADHNSIQQFVNNMNAEQGTDHKNIEEFFASDSYQYSDNKKGAV